MRQMLDQFYPPLMATAFKCFVKPHIYNFDGQVATEESASKTEDIAVIVPTTHFGGIGPGDMNRADSGNAVGHHAHAETAAANQYAPFTLPRRHRPRHSCCIVRVVDGVGAVRADVFQLMMQVLEIGHENFFQFPPGMVASDYYLHGGAQSSSQLFENSLVSLVPKLELGNERKLGNERNVFRLQSIF